MSYRPPGQPARAADLFVAHPLHGRQQPGVSRPAQGDGDIRLRAEVFHGHSLPHRLSPRAGSRTRLADGAIKENDSSIDIDPNSAAFQAAVKICNS